MQNFVVIEYLSPNVIDIHSAIPVARPFYNTDTIDYNQEKCNVILIISRLSTIRMLSTIRIYPVHWSQYTQIWFKIFNHIPSLLDFNILRSSEKK